MRFICLLFLPWLAWCCAGQDEARPEVVESDAVKTSAGDERLQEVPIRGVVAPAVALPDAASVDRWVAVVNDGAAADSSRRQAAEHLLEIDYKTLGGLYRSKGNEHLIRALIEEKIKKEDESVLPLVLLLFEQVGSEERIDFEHYILVFGRRAEADLYPLLHANNRSIALRAMDTLAKMRSAPAADSIALFLAHDSVWMRMGAAHALGEIGAVGAAGHLVQTLDDSAYAVVNAALVGLGRLKAVEAYASIEGLLAAENKHVRKHAAMALGELGDRRALAKVRAMAADDEDAGVRFMAGKAAEKLEKIR